MFWLLYDVGVHCLHRLIFPSLNGWANQMPKVMLQDFKIHFDHPYANVPQHLNKQFPTVTSRALTSPQVSVDP